MVGGMIAYCGLDCLSCRAYTAMKENNLEKLRETAELWSVGENEKYRPEDIPCEGCFSDRLHKFCLECPVRLCGREYGVKNCAGCGGLSMRQVREALEFLRYGLWHRSKGEPRQTEG
jgi:hypothetical protein